MKNINEITIPVYFQMPKCGSTFVRHTLWKIADIYGKSFLNGNESVKRFNYHIKDPDSDLPIAQFGAVLKEGKTMPTFKNCHVRRLSFNKKNMDLISENFHVVYIFFTTFGIVSDHYNIILKYFQDEDLYKIISSRDPFQFEISLYDYIRSEKSKHEPTHKIIKEKTFEDYTMYSDHFGDSLLIRAFAGVGQDRQITDEDYELTERIIQKFHKIDVSTQSLKLQMSKILEICYGIDSEKIECFPPVKSNKGVEHRIKTIDDLPDYVRTKFLERKHYDYLLYNNNFKKGE